MDPTPFTDELTNGIERLKSLIEAREYEKGLHQGLLLLDKFHGNPLLHYAIAVCLVETGHISEAPMHLEVAAAKFSLANQSGHEELGQLIAISSLLARTGYTANVIPLIKKNLKFIVWPNDDILALNELTNICMTAESPETSLELLEHSFETYANTNLLPNICSPQL